MSKGNGAATLVAEKTILTRLKSRPPIQEMMLMDEILYIGQHFKNIFAEGELIGEAVVKDFFATVS